MKKLFFLASVIVLSLSACSNDSKMLSSREWLLEKAVVGGKVIEKMPQERPVVTFSDTMTINGKGGCNYFFGKYELKGGKKISFSSFGMTRRMCPDENFEMKYMQALGKVASFEIKGDSLILNGADKGTRLSYSGKE